MSSTEQPVLLAERSLISLILRDPSKWTDVLDEGITPDHFTLEGHRRIFQAMQQDPANINLTALSAKFPDGVPTLARLSDENPYGSVSFFGGVLIRGRQRNAILEALTGARDTILNSDILQEDQNSLIELRAVLNQLEEDDRSRSSAATLDHGVELFEAQVLKRQAGEIGRPINIRKIDSILNGGLGDGQLITFGARPGSGKTALALQAAIENSKTVPVGFITIEMDLPDLTANIVSYLSGIDSRAVRTGIVGAYQEEYDKAKKTARDLQLLIHETDGDFSKIVTTCRRMVRRQGVKLLVIDYIQIIKTFGRFKSRHDELTHVSVSLKRLARELNVPIVICAQLRRETEGRKTGPRASDIKESGAIEQDSDVVILLERLSHHPKTAMYIHVAKNRRGMIGRFPVFADYTCGLIREIRDGDPSPTEQMGGDHGTS